jgi:tetratricopeptide (TPR) repeat protein
MTDSQADNAIARWKKASQLARKHRSLVWEEASLLAWANLALAEAQVRQADHEPRAADYLQQAEQQARALEKYNRPEAALLLGQASFLRSSDRKEAVRIFEKGTQQARTQDLSSLVRLRVTLAAALLAAPQDLDTATKHAREACRLAQKKGVDQQNRAEAFGTYGITFYLRSPRTPPNPAALEGIRWFRAALKEAPDHHSSWMWCWLLAELLDRKPQRTAAEEKELHHRIAEAKRKFPDTRQNVYYRYSLFQLYDKVHKR